MPAANHPIFVHISDLHLTGSPGEQLNPADLPEISDPDRYRARIIDEVRAITPTPSFIIVSGDLVNDPSVAAYERARAVVAELEQIAPVLLGLGNHDDRSLFRQVVLGDPSDTPTAPFFHSTTIAGLRIIMLDSTVPGDVGGRIGPDQLAWLDAQLRELAPVGTVVVLHHAVVDPFAVPNEVWQDEWKLADAAALEAVIARHEVLGVLLGHVHIHSMTTFGGTFAVSVNSLVSALNPTQVAGQFRPGAGFNVCSVQDGRLIINPVSIA